MESDTFYGDFMLKLTCILPGNLICHISSMKTPDNLRTNFAIKSSSLSTLSR